MSSHLDLPPPSQSVHPPWPPSYSTSLNECLRQLPFCFCRCITSVVYRMCSVSSMCSSKCGRNPAGGPLQVCEVTVSRRGCTTRQPKGLGRWASYSATKVIQLFTGIVSYKCETGAEEARKRGYSTGGCLDCPEARVSVNRAPLIYASPHHEQPYWSSPASV